MIGAALLAPVSAVLFGAAAPLSKLILVSLSPFQLAGLLYLGAAVGVAPRLVLAKDLKPVWKIPRGSRGLLAGAVNLGIGLAVGPCAASWQVTGGALLVGVFCYGISIVLYITAAQRTGVLSAGGRSPSRSYFLASISRIVRSTSGWSGFSLREARRASRALCFCPSLS